MKSTIWRNVVMGRMMLKNLFVILVLNIFSIITAQSIEAATLRWINEVEDWESGIILGVDDLYVAETGKSWDVTFKDAVDDEDLLEIYGLEKDTRYGDLYDGARAITGYQMSSLRNYLKSLSTTNIDPRLIFGIDDKSKFNVGVINLIYNYNRAGLHQWLGHSIGIFLNSSDMALGSGSHNPDTFVTYDEIYGDRVYAVFNESEINPTNPVPVPSTIVLLGISITSLAWIARKKKLDRV